MSNIHFFTNADSIQNNQTLEMAFGPQSDFGGIEKYNLDNKFSLVANSSAYAITKSMILAIQDVNPELINIALLPINSYTLGFPVKFFIYRGIKKSSLIDNNGNIQISDSSWSENNLLLTIKKLQDKINAQTGATLQAKSESLGYNFSSLSNDIYLEQIFFDNTDGFNPIIVEEGCEIGKFLGNTTLAGIEVILDMVGYEGKLSLLKLPQHTFEIEKLTIDPLLSEKDKLLLMFKDRFKREEILSYVDITAFYGAAKNQGVKINGLINDDDFLNRFYNKNVVYIDIRDDRGFSYNHFFRFEDKLSLGFYSNTDSDEPVFTSYNYYEKWPLLRLSNLMYSTGQDYFYIEFPSMTDQSVSIVSSYVGKLSTMYDKVPKKHVKIETLNNESNLSEPVKLNNWVYLNNKLGSNYILLKRNITNVINNNEAISSVWNNFFSLKFNTIFGTDQIEEGEYRINTYSSINSPVIVNSKSGEIYYSVTGIAADKKHITFFAFKDESLFTNYNSSNFFPTPFIGKGKFFTEFNPSDYDYSEGNGNVGFLNQIVKRPQIQNFELQKFDIQDSQNPSAIVKALSYQRSGNQNISDDVFLSLETITISHDEYNLLKDYQDSVSGDFALHPVFLSCKDIINADYEKFTLQELTITLGQPSIITNEEEDFFYVDITNTDDDLLSGGSPITLSSIHLD